MACWRSFPLTLALALAAAATSLAAATTDLLPPPKAVVGWTMTEPTRTYGPGNLWEYIDGNADLFLSYGFVDLAVGDFHPAEGDGWISVEVYDMASPLHAFGIFTTERPEGLPTGHEEGVNSLTLGVQGYSSEGLTAFWKGPYYVKVSLIEGEDAAAAQQLAEATATRIAAEAARPRELDRLPAANRLPGSERYLRKSALGHGWLNEAVSAQYKIEEARSREGEEVEARGKDQEKATLYIADFGTAEKAAEGYTKLRKFHADMAKVSDFRGLWDAAFAVKDPYNGETFVARAGQILFIGMTEQGSRDAVARLVKAGVANVTAQ